MPVRAPRAAAVIDVGLVQPSAQTVLTAPEVLGDLAKRRLGFTGDSYNVTAELWRERFRHGEHPCL